MRKQVGTRILSLMLAISLFVIFSVTAFAVQARYIYDINASNSLSISGGKATMYSDMDGDSSITKVVITAACVTKGKEPTVYREEQAG